LMVGSSDDAASAGGDDLADGDHRPLLPAALGRYGGLAGAERERREALAIVVVGGMTVP